MIELATAAPMDTPPSEADRRTRVASALLGWYRASRRDLPWRRTRDAYAIWVSEMMLQQTQVATVIPYWHRWMERFPTAEALAAAPLDDVLQQWQGLGYYARARNMHRAAQVIRERHGGAFPTRFDDVLGLPGVGRYTAGAVCSIAHGQDVPLVDANVVRILCRIFGIAGDPKSTEVQTRLWERAEALIPPGRAGDLNQAMMELGALICEPRPRCADCPVRDLCMAFASGDPASLPEYAAKPKTTAQTDVSAILLHPEDGTGAGRRVLLVRRPVDGLWGGLWETPRVTANPGEPISAAAERAAREAAGVAARATGGIAATIKHGVTTRRITLVGALCDLSSASSGSAEPRETAWAAPDELGTRYPLSSPQTKLLAKALSPDAQPTLF